MQQQGKAFRLVAETGTVVAGDWSNADGEYFGLTLEEISAALEP